MEIEELSGKLTRVRALLPATGCALVAFSGGVDSTLLLKLAVDALGADRVVAVTADSASLAREDLADAQMLVASLGVEHVIIATAELDNPAYRANAGDRCYFCKHELFSRMSELAQARGISCVLYGAIGDDRPEERPGQRAAAEQQVAAPLQAAGLSKSEVRALARSLGLPNWDRPQNACLSSRVPHGAVVTAAKLGQIEAAEAALRREGFQQVRVRHLATHARIEVGAEEVGRFQDTALRARVAQALQASGFQSAGVARSGYQPGGAGQPADELPLA